LTIGCFSNAANFSTILSIFYGGFCYVFCRNLAVRCMNYRVALARFIVVFTGFLFFTTLWFLYLHRVFIFYLTTDSKLGCINSVFVSTD